MYGTAVHAALRDFFNAWQTKPANKKFLMKRFEWHLAKEAFSKMELKETLARGQKNLAGYYENRRPPWPPPRALHEFTVPALLLTPALKLTGKLDKIEFIGSGNAVNVVDYKTGKPKTRGEIEGKTKNSAGDIKRQLVFYNLLLNRHEKRKYQMVSGEIDFIEPDTSGRYRKEKFLIAPEEVSALETLIHQVAAEILELKFWEKNCNEKGCEFCRLRSFLS